MIKWVIDGMRVTEMEGEWRFIVLKTSSIKVFENKKRKRIFTEHLVFDTEKAALNVIIDDLRDSLEIAISRINTLENESDESEQKPSQEGEKDNGKAV